MARKQKAKFLNTARARTMSPAMIDAMSDLDVEHIFAVARWPATKGQPVCPKPGCNCRSVMNLKRRPVAGPKWRCKLCGHEFTLTSGTSFAYHKKTLRFYLRGILLIMNGVNGKAALALARDLGMNPKSAFVFCHKVREALGHAVDRLQIGGPGKEAEIDGVWVGGWARKANEKSQRVDMRAKENQTGKRRCVVSICERGGPVVAKVFKTEEAAETWIAGKLRASTMLHADSATNWNSLRADFPMKVVNHSERYSGPDHACVNFAEAFNSRVRRAELGVHMRISGRYLGRYASEMAFRESERRTDNGAQVRMALSLVATTAASRRFCGYWHTGRVARRQERMAAAA